MKLVIPIFALLTACDGGFSDTSREYGPAVEGDADHAVVVDVPRTLGVVDTPLVDVNGTPIGVSCATCHGPALVGGVRAGSSAASAPAAVGTLTPRGDGGLDPAGPPWAEQSWAGVDGVTTGDPRDFHTKVDLKHGKLACDACHDADRTKLHLADGTKLEMQEAMTLCSQCHGQQRTAYDHGAHGGMNGYWDLRQGPRVRNHCVSCHAPHSPAYEPVRPVHPPRDRYLDTTHATEAGGTPASTGHPGSASPEERHHE